MPTGGEHEYVTWEGLHGLLEITGTIIGALGTIIVSLVSWLFPTKSKVQDMIDKAMELDKVEDDANLKKIADELKLREELRDRQHADNQRAIEALREDVKDIPRQMEAKLRDFFNYTRGGGT